MDTAGGTAVTATATATAAVRVSASATAVSASVSAAVARAAADREPRPSMQRSTFLRRRLPCPKKRRARGEICGREFLSGRWVGCLVERLWCSGLDFAFDRNGGMTKYPRTQARRNDEDRSPKVLTTACTGKCGRFLISKFGNSLGNWVFRNSTLSGDSGVRSIQATVR